MRDEDRSTTDGIPSHLSPESLARILDEGRRGRRLRRRLCREFGLTAAQWQTLDRQDREAVAAFRRQHWARQARKQPAPADRRAAVEVCVDGRPRSGRTRLTTIVTAGEPQKENVAISRQLSRSRSNALNGGAWDGSPIKLVPNRGDLGPPAEGFREPSGIAKAPQDKGEMRRRQYKFIERSMLLQSLISMAINALDLVSAERKFVIQQRVHGRVLAEQVPRPTLEPLDRSWDERTAASHAENLVSREKSTPLARLDVSLSKVLGVVSERLQGVSVSGLSFTTHPAEGFATDGWAVDSRFGADASFMRIVGVRNLLMLINAMARQLGSSLREQEDEESITETDQERAAQDSIPGPTPPALRLPPIMTPVLPRGAEPLARNGTVQAVEATLWFMQGSPASRQESEVAPLGDIQDPLIDQAWQTLRQLELARVELEQTMATLLAAEALNTDVDLDPLRSRILAYATLQPLRSRSASEDVVPSEVDPGQCLLDILHVVLSGRAREAAAPLLDAALTALARTGTLDWPCARDVINSRSRWVQFIEANHLPVQTAQLVSSVAGEARFWCPFVPVESAIVTRFESADLGQQLEMIHSFVDFAATGWRAKLDNRWVAEEFTSQVGDALRAHLQLSLREGG